MCRNERSAARTCPVVVVDKLINAGGVAEDADVDIQPITRADFVQAKVFRSRSMNTHAGWMPDYAGLNGSRPAAFFFSRRTHKVKDDLKLSRFVG